MKLRLDIRENDLLNQINQLKSNIPIFKDIEVVIETLPLGDMIITNQHNEDKLIVERKSVTDLAASIKDGRYEEQSYRLNGLDHPNHNILYLIEGDVNRINRFKDTRMEKLTLYSAIFSLNYFKGFSVIRTFSLEETALFICNTVNKLKRETEKKPYYSNKIFIPNSNTVVPISVSCCSQEKKDDQKEDPKEETNLNQDNEENQNSSTDKDYVNVIKKVKKENITPENIGEIMLCQIPGISSVTALAIMERYKNIPNLITSLKNDATCLNEVTYLTAKNQCRKISKPSIANIMKYLLL